MSFLKMNGRELERLKNCIRMSALRKGRNEDWLDVLEEYDELRKKNLKKFCEQNFSS